MAGSVAAADVVRTTAGAQIRVPIANVTAAYTLDTDCADVQVDGRFVVIKGRRPCATHVIAVAADAITEMELIVTGRRQSIGTRMRQKDIQESGSIASFYSSNPAEMQTSMELTRSERGNTTSLSLALADGYAFSRQHRRTAMPAASLQFSGPSRRLTLLDSRVQQPALTMEDTIVRGLHLESKAWFLHAGLASISTFRQQLFERDSDRTVIAGYRFRLGNRGFLTPGLQWISASRTYEAGRSGAIGSLGYEYRQPERFWLQGELGVGRGIASAARLEYDGSSDRVRLRLRAIPSRFPGLSVGRSRGVQLTGSWTRRFTDNFGLDLSASQDSYSLDSSGSQRNSSGSARLQLRVAKPLTFSWGLAASRFSRPGFPSIDSASLPVGVSFDSRWFGNSFQYQFGRNRANELGSHRLRNAIRISAGSAMFTAFASQQTQAPTVDYVLTNFPGLRQVLLSEGIAAQSPEEIQEFVRTHADLIAARYVRDVTINIAPMRREVGASIGWTAPRSRLSTRLEWRWNDDQRIGGRSISVNKDARLSVRLTRQTDLTLGGSLFQGMISSVGLVRFQQWSVGLRVQLLNVPDFLVRAGGETLQGIVFFDEAGIGQYESSAKGITGATVILDGVRRTRTSASGEYSFKSVSPGRHTLDVVYESQEPYVFTTPSHIEADDNSPVHFGIGRRTAMLFGAVRNDGGKALADVLVCVNTSTKQCVRTSSSGSFRLSRLEPRTYAVQIDPESVPASHALDNLDPRSVAVAPDEPGRADFVIRAYRTIAGRIVCAGAKLDVSKARLRMESGDVRVALDEEGRFRIRDLASGSHQLVLTYDFLELRREIKLPPEPVNLNNVDFDVCANPQRK